MLFMTIQSNAVVTNLVPRLSNTTIIIMSTPYIVVHVRFIMDKVAMGQIALFQASFVT